MSDEPTTWKPFSPQEVNRLFSNLTIPWWIAGGWAIDLFVGRQTRTHEDIDVLILRGDQLVVQNYLQRWDLHKTNQPGLKPWPFGEYLKPGVNDVWCRQTSGSPWALQLMLLETDGDRWIYRREPRIGGPLSGLGKTSFDGLPYLSPEIQLLFKAKEEALLKDEHDFEVAVPLMTTRALKWLADSLAIQFPKGHPWISHIDERFTKT